jgi:acetolactate synthase-1/2/3 large subunit
VLLITGQNDSRILNHDPAKMFHGLDQDRFLAPVTGWRGRVTRAEEIPTAVEAIFAQFRNGRPRPAHLDVPQDILASAVDASPRPRVTRQRTVPPGANVERAAAMLGRAERPLLLAGTGALWSGAEEEVRCLAERLGVPVITTALAKGLLPEDHPLSGGDMRGRLGRELMDATDLLLAVGVRFTQNDTGAWSQQIAAPIVQIDSEERELGAEYPAALGLAGDEKATLAQFLATVPEEVRPGRSGAERRATPRAERNAWL